MLFTSRFRRFGQHGWSYGKEYFETGELLLLLYYAQLSTIITTLKKENVNIFRVKLSLISNE